MSAFQIILLILISLLLISNGAILFFVYHGITNQVVIHGDRLEVGKTTAALLRTLTDNQVKIANSIFETIQSLRRQLFTGKDTPTEAVLLQPSPAQEFKPGLTLKNRE